MNEGTTSTTPEAPAPPTSAAPSMTRQEQINAIVQANLAASDVTTVKVDTKPVAAPQQKEVSPEAFAVLARKDAKLQKEKQALKAERQALEAERTEARADVELKKSDPYAWAEKHGVTYGGWTEKRLSSTPPDKALAEVKKIQERLDAEDKRQQEARAAHEEATIKSEEQSIVASVDKLLTDDRFYRVADLADAGLADPRQAVLNIMTKSWAEAKIMLEPDEAMEVLNELLAQTEAKLVNGRMVKRVTKPVVDATEEAVKGLPAAAQARRGITTTPVEATQGAKTLTNRHAAAGSSDVPPPTDSWEARKEHMLKKHGLLA